MAYPVHPELFDRLYSRRSGEATSAAYASSTIVFAVSSAVSKWLVASYPIGEVLFTRTAVALLTCALFIMPQTGLAVFRTRRLGHHVLRSVSQGCSQTFLLIAFSLMPLAGAIAINFSAPLFATLASALVLKEAVGAARWSALRPMAPEARRQALAERGAPLFHVGDQHALGVGRQRDDEEAVDATVGLMR